MFDELPTLHALLKALQQVPYLASKNGYRVADYFLQQDERYIEQFCSLLRLAKEKIGPCATCFGWQEQGKGCQFCTAKARDQQLVCVVESWQELMAIEKAGNYKGVYHVLGGVISPLEGVNASDLTIDDLIIRAKNGAREIIFALNQTPESEATMLFIAKRLKEVPVTLSCLARGLPVGSCVEAMDRLTIYKALSERRPL